MMWRRRKLIMRRTLCSSLRTCHKSHFMRKLTRKIPQAKTALHVLCEPAPSTCIWTCHKSMRKFTGKMARAPEVGRTFCASLRSRNAHGHVTIKSHPCFAEIYRHKCAPQQLGARFVRACAVDMYMDMSQENAEICRQNGAPQKLGARFVRACAVEINMDMSQSRAMSCRNLQAQARAPAVRRTFCASLRNQNAHRHVT